MGIKLTLAPEIKLFLEAQALNKLPAVWEAPISVIRANTQARVGVAGPAEAIFAIHNRFNPGPTADLPIRIYRPSAKKDLPAIVFFHGGGWAVNFLDIYDAALSHLANKSGALIISVNYQKAPEHPFPIPFDDCYSTFLWVRANATDLGVDLTKIGVAGDSAGANLAAAVALKARDNSIPLAFQLLVYPAIEKDFETDSYTKNGVGLFLTKQAMQWFWQQYVPDPKDDTNPYACPAFAKSFASLAPAIIIAAEYDPLLSDCEKYARLLESDGSKVIYKLYEGMIHSFYANVAVTPASTQALDFSAEQIIQLTQ